jgi:hypothetical protein
LRMTRKADERMLGAASMKSNTKKSGISMDLGRTTNSFFSPVTPLQNRKKVKKLNIFLTCVNRPLGGPSTMLELPPSSQKLQKRTFEDLSLDNNNLLAKKKTSTQY